MSVRPLLIDDGLRALIAEAIKKAASKPTTLEEIIRHSANVPQGGDNLSYKDVAGLSDDRFASVQHVPIPIGYMASFSFECQKAGLCRHLSISVNAPGAFPHPAAVSFIAEAFGFVKGAPCHIFREEYQPGYFAINIIELVVSPGSEKVQ